MSGSWKEQIAIVGIGCRFPGQINSPDSFWDFICRGGDAITEIPAERWNLDAFFSGERSRKGEMYARHGGFISGLKNFDASFFGFSPREAATLDPQQRMLLEVTWEAFEDANMVPSKWAGHDVGVFVGLFMHDFENMHTSPSEYELFSPYSATGISTSVAANRLSHVFDFRGPSMVVDTACSSSLVAIHLACKSLLDGESSLALAGGVNALLQPEMYMTLCQANMLGPSGRCHTFSAKADGYVRAEGAGVILLKKLSQAKADGDTIYAVLRGTAVNQDGGTPSISQPNEISQVKVAQRALKVSGLEGSDIGFVEAHGTGTPVGDPIEARSLGQIYGTDSAGTRECVIGSVKTNFGHTESAAGIAGVIKAALMVNKGKIPPNLHFEEPNPEIDFAKLGLRVPVSLEEWTTASDLRRVAINSFGFGGTNAHAIIEQAVEHKAIAKEKKDKTVFSDCQILGLSGHTKEALAAQASALVAHIDAHSDLQIADLAHTYLKLREQLGYRAAIIANELEDLRDSLQKLSEDVLAPSIVRGEHQATKRKTAIVFSGMGQQWPAMARELYEQEPLFRSVVDDCAQELAKHTTEWSLVEELLASEETSKISRCDVAQPCIFAVQLGLFELFKAAGFEAHAVLGHSVGETTAFHVAGVFDLSSAMKLVYHRGRLQQTTAGKGAMLAVGLTEAECADLLRESKDVSIAAINSSSSLTLAGEKAELENIAKTLADKEIFARFVPVDVPFHSPAMDPILDELQDKLADMTVKEPEMPLISTVNANWVAAGEGKGAYWAKNVRDTVRFRDSLELLFKEGYDCIVEVSAHPVLGPSIKECAANVESQVVTVPTIRRRENSHRYFLAALAKLYCAGCTCALDIFAQQGVATELPPYQWQRSEHWSESDESRQYKEGERVSADGLIGPKLHPLLGGKVDVAQACWRNEIELTPELYLRDHIVDGVVVHPAAAYIEAALAAGAQRYGQVPTSLEEFEIVAPLVHDEREASQLESSLSAKGELSIQSRKAGADSLWSLNAQCRLSGRAETEESSSWTLEQLTESKEKLESQEIYERLASHSLIYGPAFQTIKTLVQSEEGSRAHLKLAEGTSALSYEIHPSLIDGAFQVMALNSPGGTYLPVSVHTIEYYGSPGAEALVESEPTELREDSISANLRLYSTDGKLALRVKGLTCQKAKIQVESKLSLAKLIHKEKWLKQISQSGQDLPTPSDFFELAKQRVERLVRSTNRDTHYKRVEPLLDEVTKHFVVAAFKELGWKYEKENALTFDEIVNDLGVVPQHHSLLRRLLQLQVQWGFLAQEAERWTIKKTPPEVCPQSSWNNALWQAQDALSELQLIGRCGENLAEVLSGREDPLALVFAPGSDAVEHVYRQSPTVGWYNQAAGQVLASLYEKLPSSRPLKVLEVGAGTGGLTAHLLEALPYENVDFYFSDVSMAFIKEAKRRFGKRPGIRFGLLDVSKSPEEQGFVDKFDLIVASDIVHATPSLHQSLTNLRSLLVPNGLLMLVELTNVSTWFDLVFGMLDGWWAFTDKERRKDHAMLSLSSWKTVLAEEGFADIQSISDSAENNSIHEIILAKNDTAEEEKLQTAVVEEKNKPIVVYGQCSQQAKAAAMLLEEEVELFSLAEFSQEVLAKQFSHNSSDELRLIYLTQPSIELETPAHNRACFQVLEIVRKVSNSPFEIVNFNVVTSLAQSVEAKDKVDPGQAMLWGLGRCLAAEFPLWLVRLIDVETLADKNQLAEVLSIVARNDSETEYAIRGTEIYCQRLVRTHVAEKDIEPKLLATLVNNEILVRHKAIGLNFKDLARWRGLVKGDVLGLECAGVVVAVGPNVDKFRPGDEVYGFSNGFSASLAKCYEPFLCKKPDNLTFNEAATLPIVGFTAIHTLENLAHLQEGETILIHRASGGVGLAALQLAQSIGAEIIATAGNDAKQDFLRRLGVKHVYSSRSFDFVEEIKKLTAGKGVNVIVNTLDDEGLRKSIELLTPATGRVVDLSTVHSRGVLPTAALKRGNSLHSFDLEDLVIHAPEMVSNTLCKLNERVQKGLIHPLPYRNFPTDEIHEACRVFEKARHVGKFIVTPAISQMEREVSETSVEKIEDPILITGGLGGLGLSLSSWLIEQGYKSLVLLGRSGIKDKVTQLAIEELKSKGAEVNVIKADVTKRDELQATISKINKEIGPLRGVIHAAMVLDDALVANLQDEQLARALAPKSIGSWNLHVLTKEQPLDFFILFSSFSSLLGLPGQGGYAAGNTFMDSLVKLRRSESLPALSIGWGPIARVGYVAMRQELVRDFHEQGVLPLGPSTAWKAMKEALDNDDLSHFGLMDIDWNAFVRQLPGVANRPRFGRLLSEVPDEQSKTEDGPALASSRFSSEAERRDYLLEVLTSAVGNVLGMSVDDDKHNVPLEAMGFDSLLAVELSAEIQKIVGVKLAKMSLLQGGISISRLTSIVEGILGGEGLSKEDVIQPPAVEESPSVDVDALDDEQVEQMLAKMLIGGEEPSK